MPHYIIKSRIRARSAALVRTSFRMYNEKAGGVSLIRPCAQ